MALQPNIFARLECALCGLHKSDGAMNKAGQWDCGTGDQSHGTDVTVGAGTGTVRLSDKGPFNYRAINLRGAGGLTNDRV